MENKKILSVFYKQYDFFERLALNEDNFCVNYLNEDRWGDKEETVLSYFNSSDIGNQTFVYGSIFATPYEETDDLDVIAVFMTEKAIFLRRLITDNEEHDDEYYYYISWDDVYNAEKNDNYHDCIDFYNKDGEEIGCVFDFELSGSQDDDNTIKWLNIFTAVIKAAHTTQGTSDDNIQENIDFSRTSSVAQTSTIKTSINMGIDKRKVEYVIGIDLGHGETSAAICPMQWDAQADQLEDAKDLDMGGNKKVMPSAITLLDDGRAYIGDAAFNPDILKQAHVHVCFKQAPKDIDGEPEKLMIRFMAEVYKTIRENNSGLLTDDNHVVYIATPSGWNKNQQDLYVKMAEKAGLPIAGVTKESRAAFVRAQRDATSGIGRNVSKGAIVFDMGSSTLDFTYMNKNLPNLIDQGYNCGASAIEKAIFKIKEQEDDSIQLFEKKFPDLVDYLVFEARKVKEQVYFNPELRVKKTVNFDDIIEDEDLEDERFKLVFQPGELNKMLEDDGYIKSITDAMCDYQSNFINGQKIYGVFMTGGASRMNFLKPLISKCWNVDESQIYRDQDPSLTISQGVAEVARLDFHTSGQDKGLEEMIDKAQNSNDIYETFIQEFGHALWENVTDAMGAAIAEWKDCDNDLSVNDLRDRITSAAKKSSKKFSAEAPAYIDAAIESNTQEICTKVNAIISLYASQGYEVNVPKPSIGEINIPGVNLDGVMSELAEKLKDDSSGWGAAIGGAAVAGTVAFLLGGPLMWTIGGALAIGKFLFGNHDSEDEKKRKALAKKLDHHEREEVYNSLSEDWGNICSSVAESISKSLRGNHNIKTSINTVVRELMQAYKENLKNARILVD